MEVKISYGIDLKDVPKLIEERLNICSDILDKLSQTCATGAGLISFGDGHDNKKCMPVALELVEQARHGLVAIDKSLTDVQMILTGFITAEEQPPVEPPPVEEPDAG